MKITREAYEKLIAEDIERLRNCMPECPEREHIILVLNNSIYHNYHDGLGCKARVVQAARQQAQAVLLDKEMTPTEIKKFHDACIVTVHRVRALEAEEERDAQ